MSGIDVRDYFLTKEDFQIVPSKHWEGVLETHPIPENLDRYYDSKEYLSHNKDASLMSVIYQKVQSINLRNKFKLVDTYAEGRRMLDYGCGVGDFVRYMELRGFDTWGYEPNTKAVQRAQEDLPKVHSSEDFIHDNEFDVITLWHVLEHIPAFEEKLNMLGDAMSSSGLLCIAVPNYTSFDARYYKHHWAAYDVPRHLWHFSPQGMDKILTNAGFNLLEKAPLWFDSFFVSLLSEKYKGNPLGPLRAFCIGALSNILALRDKNFSSVVYIARKA